MSVGETVYQQVKKNVKIKKWFIQAGAMLAALVFAGHTWAETAIRSISSGAQSGEIVVKIELSQPLKSAPKGFVIQNPARIALDLPGVVNGMDRSLIELSQGNLHSITVAQASDRARLVFNLGNATTYSVQQSGNTLLVRLAAPRPVAPPSAALEFSPATAQGSGSDMPVNTVKTNEVQNIDFRTSADGAGSMIVTLPSDQTTIDIRQQGSSIVVELMKTKLPASLRKKLDVRDFRTPVQSISAEQKGENVRLTVVPTGLWEQSAFQAGNQFVLEFHPLKEDPNKLVPGVGYRGERLSLSFQNVDVRTLLQVIADITDFNIVTSDSVRGSLTLRLKDVPWDQALDIIMQARGLSVEKTGNVLWIAPRDEINNMRIDKVKTQNEIEVLEPVRTQVFQLNYARALAIYEVMTKAEDGGGGHGRMPQLLSERGSVIADGRTNKLIVTDVPTRLESLSVVLQQLDIPVRQVMIEARIVQANEGWGRSVGMRLSGFMYTGKTGRGYIGGTQVNEGGGGSSSSSSGNSSSSTKPDYGGLRSPGSYDNPFNSDNDNFSLYNFPAYKVLGRTTGSFAFGFRPSANKYLQLEIQALEADSEGRTISSPRLMTADSITARVAQGVEIPYQEASSSGATSTSFREAELSLEVTPQITPDGNVNLEIYVSKDARGDMTDNGPSINTNRIKTQVTIENGGTVVIGGVYTQDELSRKEKIPLLGDIPLLGRFFRASAKEITRSELLIFVTPRIVNDGLIRNPGVTPSMSVR